MKAQSNKIKIIVALFFLVVLIVGIVVIAKRSMQGNHSQSAVRSEVIRALQQGEQAISATERAVSTIEPVNPAASTNAQNVLLAVPFTVQAPFANWSDPVFQNACEESSVVMAMGWINGLQSISPQDANSQILDIVAFENKTFGYNADTNAVDVVRIFKEHFNQQHVSLQENITTADIINELQKGNVVLVPAFGQVLGNPNYTAPGPIGHMLVIVGYDTAAKQFITNDPGTKHGKNYRYDENVLFNAIWEYPSGVGPLIPPAKADMKKAMIVVSKN